jgi:hypothetical protein
MIRVGRRSRHFQTLTGTTLDAPRPRVQSRAQVDMHLQMTRPRVTVSCSSVRASSPGRALPASEQSQKTQCCLQKPQDKKSVDPTIRNNLTCVTKTDELMVQETRMVVMD